MLLSACPKSPSTVSSKKVFWLPMKLPAHAGDPKKVGLLLIQYLTPSNILLLIFASGLFLLCQTTFEQR